MNRSVAELVLCTSTGESEKKTEKKPFETEYVCVFKKMCEYLCENVLTREFEG